MTGAPLQLINVSKSFDGRPAVKSISLEAPEGGILGFLGPNGAGKSTTLRMALGVVSPDSGEARLFGGRPDLNALKRVGFLPEERGLYRKMSARSVIAYFAQLKGMSGRDAMARAEELLERHGLGHARKTRISRLSKGMAQKVQILSTLAHSPDLIILDEPFSGLDPVNQQDLESLIRKEHARGATIIFSTHVMEHAERLCDRLVIIGKGEKRFDGSVTEAMALIPERAAISTEHGYDLASALGAAGFSTQLESSSVAGDDWVIALSQGRKAQDVLRTAIDAGAPILGFAPKQARLRDVFVSLVGDTPQETPDTLSGRISDTRNDPDNPPQETAA